MQDVRRYRFQLCAVMALHWSAIDYLSGGGSVHCMVFVSVEAKVDMRNGISKVLSAISTPPNLSGVSSGLDNS